jgi:hypothetical protein
MFCSYGRFALNTAVFGGFQSCDPDKRERQGARHTDLDFSHKIPGYMHMYAVQITFRPLNVN